MAPDRTLIFVYNADSGLYNTLADMGHKIFSPATYACQLCALTHGYFSMHEDWANFLAELEVELVFLHRDEFIGRFPALAPQLPAVFLQQAGSTPQCLLSAEQINQCQDLPALKGLLEQKLHGA